MMKQKSKFKQTEIGLIPEEWKFDELNKHAKIIMGQSPESKYYNVQENGTVFLQGVRTFGSFYPIYDTWTTKVTKLAKKDSVLLSVRAPVGEVNIANREVCIGRGLMSIDGKNNRFIFYLFKNFKTYVTNKETGTVYGSVTRDDMSNIKFPFPEEKEQSAIAKVLSDLDSKIELNQQMDRNLESIGKTIFDHWFNADDVPENWEVKPLDKIAEFLNGLPLQKYPAIEGEECLPVIKIRELRNGISDQTDKACLDIPEDYLIEDGDVLFSWSGTLEVEIWTNGQGALNQHLFKVTSDEYPKWFYYYWTKHHLKRFRHIAKGKATTMGHIQRHNLSESNTIIPDKKRLEEMDEIMSPLIEKIILLRIESRRLAEIRDSLLPRLMSGKIRVPVEVHA